ncbi:AAA family ATPase [soil metagenome]
MAEASIPILGLEEDEEGARIVGDELRLFRTITAALDAADQRTRGEGASRSYDDARLLELREDVSTAKPEDLPALFEQMHTLGAIRAQRGKSSTGAIDRKSPYFGHLRLEEGGKRRDVLIGARSYLDSNAGVRIVDWRNAPVSKIFYRYQEGDDYEEELGERIVEGSVTIRRTVAISGGELVRVSSLHGTFVRQGDRWKRIEAQRARLRTDDASKARLGLSADASRREDRFLPEISSMLDPAQFELIAKPGSGVVAIQGSAGSCKTTFGLHRAAYLAFADPRRFRPERMLIVVPNDALRHYVARVLPSLGVEGVNVTTFHRFAARAVVELFPKLPSAISDDTPSTVSRAKSHPAILRAATALRDSLVQDLDTRVKTTMDKWPSGDVVIRAWGEISANIAPDARVSVLGAWLAGKRPLGKDLAKDLPDVTRAALEKLGHDLRALTRAVIPTWDELLTSRERLGKAFAGIPSFSDTKLDQVHDWCVKQSRIRSEGERDGDAPSVDAEDRALLLRLWQLLRGPLVDTDGQPIRLAHLFVDEVQDASPVELRVLMDLADQEQCVTLSGDVAQRMDDEDVDRGEFHWAELLEELGLPATKLEPLKVSYRSTAEITQFARAVLGPLAHDAEPIATRHGPPVELFQFASSGEAVAFLADALRQLHGDEPTASVALVARFPQQAELYFEGLERAEVPNIRRVARQDFTFEPGFDVTDIRQTKGLEFDEVILLDTNEASFPDRPPARHALYVGATRAAHQLWCVTGDKPSPVVVAALAAIEPPAPEPPTDSPAT